MTETACNQAENDLLQPELSTAEIPLADDAVEQPFADFVMACTPMSKNAVKKQLKRDRMVQKRKLKKQIARDERHKQALIDGRNIAAEQALVEQRTLSGDGWKRRQLLWEQEKIPLIRKSFHICIDCSYENLMTPKEIASLAAQIRCCYAYNKRNPFPCQLVVSDLCSSRSPLTLELLQKETGYDDWPNRAYVSTGLPLEEYYRSGNYIEPCHISHIVYLTSDSDNTLTSLDNDTVYVIGGIVDRNRCKGVAHARATSMMSSADNGLSITTAKLPLSEYIQHMPSTPVLTINHVFDILLQYRNHNHDWYSAFRNVLPQRKEAHFIETETKA